MTARVQWFAVLIGVGVFVLTANVVNASEQSKRLYARGLVDLNAGRTADALRLFERAVQADPEDVYALYYRGVARGRSGDFAGAITDLRAVVAGQGDVPEAPLELGVAMVQTGQYAEALPWLEQAQHVARTAPRASLFLGIARLRLGQVDAARTSFERAAEDRSLLLSAHYYLGLVAYRQGAYADAEKHFTYVTGRSPESAMGHEATAFLAEIRQTKRPAAALYGAVGFQYDSNVILAPSDEVAKTALQISKQADGRTTLTAGGAYSPWSTERVELSLGYEFFQSLHFQLSDFNIQDHRPSAQIVATVGNVQLGLLGRYDYYFLDTDSFLQEVTGSPWAAVSEGDFGRTEIFALVRWQDFKKRTYSDLLDALNLSPGVRQFVYLGSPDRYVSVGYRFDREDNEHPHGEQFAYDGNEAEVGLGWPLPAAIDAAVTYAYRNEKYDPLSGGRVDDEHEVVVALYKHLGGRFGLSGGYFGTFNDSNQKEFQYDRHILSLALEVRFF